MGYEFLAFDLGASSGRAMLGCFDGEKITLEEIHRFSNDPVYINGSLNWDILRLTYEIKQGLLKCFNKGHKNIESIAVDTWGVDFGILDNQGKLLANPYHYRDSRTDGMMDKVFEIVPRETVFEETGIQFLFFNTIYQLMAMKNQDSTALKNADKLLLIPDLINYFLTGKKYTEYSNASTTQLFDPKTGTWAYELIDSLGIDRNIFTEIIDSGTVIGNLSKEVCSELGIKSIPVIAAASHDTGSAVVSVPAEDEKFAYISCGTWSLMGVELKEPMINEKSLKHNFTNEGGVNRTTRFLKNIMGLWILQESRRQWQREGEEYSFPQLLEMAAEEKPLDIFIDPDDLTFAAPGDMPERIREYLRKTGQRVPETKGGIVRCISESLAMKYRYTLLNIEEIIGYEINCIHMVGGGIQDKTLCQFTANATGKQVLAGPIEATALGNIAVQAIAMKKIKDISEARKIIKKSFPIDVYDPENTTDWNEAYNKFLEVTNL